MSSGSLRAPLNLLRCRRAREWAIWWLAFALPLHGMAAVVTQWIGAQHFHRAVALAEQHSIPHPHLHPHGSVQRHHHAATDASVATIGAAHDAAADQSAAAGGWGWLQAPLTRRDTPADAALAHAQPRARAWHVLRVGAGPIEHPS